MRAILGLTQDEVARTQEWSAAKVHRIEKGISPITKNDLAALLRSYGVTDPLRVDELQRLAQAARRQRQKLPYSTYGDVLTLEARRFFAYEQNADRISEVAMLVLPGLLQTPAYTRALLSGGHGTDSTRFTRLAEIRADRQQRITAADGGPRLHFYLDEAVLTRAIGGPSTMLEQLDHLGELSRRPTVTVRIIPLALGANPGLRGSFVLLEFLAEGAPAVVYLEDRRGDSVEDAPEVTDGFRDVLAELARDAAPADRTAAALDAARAVLRAGAAPQER
ncbi:hypothetical protein GCM10009836_65860 [Pseudonocardia ailaonensis]|uniref:HTH cro/C1-type domain-containing protein n=2 Tax=Pseudonocardia ailaonensis TaxID=367279 RepID=A0ABN2NPH5_9PSEU